MHQSMCALTCDSVLCVCVCFSKGSGTDGVSCREKLGWHGAISVQTVNIRKISDVSSISSARCGTAPHHTTTPITAVYQHMYVHLQIQKCTHKHMCTHAHTHTPVSSLLLMAVPKARIFGLPLTSEMMSQTRRKVSLVHFSFRYKCRNLFCWV